MMNDPYSFFTKKAADIRDEIQDVIHGAFYNLQTRCSADDPAILKIWECLNDASNAMRVACMESCKLGTGERNE